MGIDALINALMEEHPEVAKEIQESISGIKPLTRYTLERKQDDNKDI